MPTLYWNRRTAGLAILAGLLVLLGEACSRTGQRGADPADQRQQATEELEALRARWQELAQRVAGLQDLARAQRAPARVLDQISLVLPDLVWLERLSLRGKSVTIEGRAAGTGAIANFVESLGEIPGFGEPDTRSITMSRGEYGFSLAVAVDPAALLDPGPNGGPSPPAAPPHPAASAAELRAGIGALETRLDQLLPSSRQADDLLRRIRALAQPAGVALLRFKPRAVVGGDSYRRWPIDVSLEAPYFGLVSFLDQIGEIGRIVVPRDVDVVAVPGGSMTTATLVLTAYLQPEGESGSPPPG